MLFYVSSTSGLFKASPWRFGFRDVTGGIFSSYFFWLFIFILYRTCIWVAVGLASIYRLSVRSPAVRSILITALTPSVVRSSSLLLLSVH